VSAATLYAALIERSGDQCEATVNRARKKVRCDRASIPGRALMVAPRDASIDPGSATAARLTPADLAVWCPDCLEKARAAARKAARAVKVIPGQIDALNVLGGGC
jgi:hypothetical protein